MRFCAIYTTGGEGDGNEFTQEEYLTVKDIANIFGFSPRTIERLASEGRIPATDWSGMADSC